MIETRCYRCHFPEDHWLCSTDGNLSVLDLVGPRDVVICLQSPRILPPLSELVVPGQQVEEMEATGETGWIELSYSYQGVAYRQRHRVLAREPGNLAITVQAPSPEFDDARTTMESVASSLEPTGVYRSTHYLYIRSI
jgi:hypothetical protein